MLITNGLAAAIAELRRNAALPGDEISRQHPELIKTFRTAAIKSFEMCYELAIKLIRRELKTKAAVPEEVDKMDFKPLMRAAAEAGLVDEPEAWFVFRDKRNITSHTYDEDKALDVLASIPHFLAKVTLLLERLQADARASA